MELNKQKYLIITKDAMCTDYLPPYGNSEHYTPNISELADKGTIFRNHYTAAPSTVMAFYSMITGKYAHETNYELFEKFHDKYDDATIFSKLKQQGFECHFLWDSINSVFNDYFDLFRDDVKVHVFPTFRQGVGAHYKHEGFLEDDPIAESKTFKIVRDIVSEITSASERLFLWIHFPHVINGRTGYGSDIELFDKYIGLLRQFFDDDCIVISADHGNMNGHKGKLCYGFDAYQPNARIPLITPRINGIKEILNNTSNVDLYSIICGKVPERDFVYTDTAYRGQFHRILAIYYKNYKLVYHKNSDKTELFDLATDPTEEFSLYNDYYFDSSRNAYTPARELYYYSNWSALPEIRKVLLEEKDRIWRNGNSKNERKNRIRKLLIPFKTFLLNFKEAMR